LSGRRQKERRIIPTFGGDGEVEGLFASTIREGVVGFGRNVCRKKEAPDLPRIGEKGGVKHAGKHADSHAISGWVFSRRGSKCRKRRRGRATGRRTREGKTKACLVEGSSMGGRIVRKTEEVERFVLHWGDMGDEDRGGGVSQMREKSAETLCISLSNVSTKESDHGDRPLSLPRRRPKQERGVNLFAISTPPKGGKKKQHQRGFRATAKEMERVDRCLPRSATGGGRGKTKKGRPAGNPSIA